MAGSRSRVDDVELDLGRYELRRHGRRVKLENKPMELLILLVGRREQLVLRKEIVKKLWRSDLFIDTETNLNNIVRKVRTALGDDPDKPRFLETVVGKGYRFIGPVRVIDAQTFSSDRGQSSVHSEGSGEWGERPSLAILPLVPLAGTTDHGVCVEFADALIARLGNLKGVDVLPASSVLNAPLEAAASETASYLGVRFVLHGAIQVTKGVSRASVEMFDAHFQTACFRIKRDLDASRLSEFEDEIVKQLASTLNRSADSAQMPRHARYSKDPLACSEFLRGYRLSSSTDPALMDEAIQRLSNAVTRDPSFSLAHATLSQLCATRHFGSDPANVWLEKAEFHCRRALELDAELPEGHVANAFLVWGPSKNFQHLEAIAELKRALALQKNLPHAYNRLGTILAHIGLLDHAREMYERGRPFHPRKAISPSVVQVHIWNREYEPAREQIEKWRAESPGNKYAIYFAPQPAMMTGQWEEAERLLEEGLRLLPGEPIIISLQGLLLAMTGRHDEALECATKACASPKSFGHAHHTYYQIACIHALAGRRDIAFEWLERSVSSGFACWPFFMKDPCLENLQRLPEFEEMVSSLQAKYPDHLGLL